MYPTPGDAAQLIGGVVSASVDNVAFTPLLTFDDSVMDGWNEFSFNAGLTPTQMPQYRYFRYTPPALTGVYIAELQYIGYAVAAIGSGSCPVTVTFTPGTASTYSSNAPTVATAATNLVYNLGVTPFVTAVSPNQGTALGGTALTITGSALSTVTAVIVNGVPCTALQVLSSTSVTCVTAPRGSAPLQFSLQVQSTVGGATFAYTPSPWFRYIDKWSSLNTWLNNEPPVTGDFVVVPYGQAVEMDVSPPQLSVLLIQGVMTFATDVPVLNLDAQYILVFGGASRWLCCFSCCFCMGQPSHVLCSRIVPGTAVSVLSLFVLFVLPSFCPFVVGAFVHAHMPAWPKSGRQRGMLLLLMRWHEQARWRWAQPPRRS